jgi:selenocysteine-specific elongation factor
MRHLIFGTAGHVDHGKTTLLRALTGCDCDTHPEEKRRGITINLGFTHHDTTAGRISFIDVPGHKDFISTMVAGAGGIDKALLVIAADEGVMPQTLEHLHILTLLGIDGGIVVLSRTDLVDADTLHAARAEVQQALHGSCLHDAPIIPVSSHDGNGMAELRAALDSMLLHTTERRYGELFRLYIDRAFTVVGQGVVVAGTVLGGSVERGQSLLLHPQGTTHRIRGIQCHGRDTDRASGGDRAALNLVGVRREDIRNGMLLATKTMQASNLLDARIEMTAEGRSLAVRSQALMILATQRSEALLHLLDCDRLSSGEQALAQLHVNTPCFAFPGDRFILRSTSGDMTLGGGVIIDAHPLHHRRRRDTVLQNLRRIADTGWTELIANEARKARTVVSCEDIADRVGLLPKSVEAIASAGLPDDVRTVKSDSGVCILREELWQSSEKAVLRQLTLFHKRNPLEDGGCSAEELLSGCRLQRNAASESALRALLADCERGGKLKRVGNTWTMYEHSVSLTEKDVHDIALVEGFHRRDDMSAPLMSELRELTSRAGITERRMHHILFYLTRRGTLIRIGDEYLHRQTVDACRRILLEGLEHDDQGLTVAAFRDIVSGNRRICLLLLACFDNEGCTERRGDLRCITAHGLQVLAQLRQQDAMETTTHPGRRRHHTMRKRTGVDTQ